jgi:hypothetical protein
VDKAKFTADPAPKASLLLSFLLSFRPSSNVPCHLPLRFLPSFRSVRFLPSVLQVSFRPSSKKCPSFLSLSVRHLSFLQATTTATKSKGKDPTSGMWDTLNLSSRSPSPHTPPSSSSSPLLTFHVPPPHHPPYNY